MVVTSDFGSESPGSSPGSPTKRDNLIKAIKDKKKFGGTSLVPRIITVESLDIVMTKR